MKPELVVDGLAFGEGPRWRDGRLWFSDMHDGDVLALDPATGAVERICSVQASPSGLGWLPDGRLLVVSMTDRRLLRREPDGSLAEHASLADIATFHCNDMVVDGRGNAYVGNFGSDFEPGVRRQLADLAIVRPDGSAAVAARGLAFPNGSVITPDGGTLIVAETMGRCLTAFDIEADGSLSSRRVWADLGRGLPDGTCLDAEGAIWYADPRAGTCNRVRAGGEIIQTVETDGNCYACALGGDGRRTLYLLTARVDDPDEARAQRSGCVWAVAAPAPGVGWP